MQPSNSIIVLLALLLAVLNGKEIVEYIQWFRFKIRVYFKQLEDNEKNQTESTYKG